MNSTTPVNPTSHVDEVTGLLYIEGQLEPAAAREVVAHLERCSPCRRLLDTLKRESLLLRAALTEADEPLPEKLAAPQFTERRAWGWLIALGLAGAGIYTLWNAYVSPWMDSLEQSGFGGQYVFTWLVFNGAFWKGWNDMLQWLILGSLGVLASVVLYLIRRNLRRFASFSFFLALLLGLSLGFAPAAGATEFVKTHSTYELPAGQTVHQDLFIFANSAHIDGTLDGDLYFFGHSLTVDGEVMGDVFAFGDAVRIKGKINGSVRTFTQSMAIEGSVTRNVLSFIKHFDLPRGGSVGGSATLFVADMQVQGRVGRDLCAFAAEGNVNGPVGGEVRLSQDRHATETIVVGPQAKVDGPFIYRGPHRPDVSPQAVLASAPRIEISHDLPDYLRGRSYWYNAMIWGMAFVTGMLLISVAPDFVQQTSREVGRIGVPLLVGVVGFVALPIIALIACITVVGIGVGMATFFLWLFMVFFAQIFAGLWLGELMLGRTRGTWPITGRLALGLLVLRLLALVPVVGIWVRFLSCALGIGAVAIYAYRRMAPQLAPPAPAMPPPAPAV
ncbi:MAG TPA: zf-HC2 domain-containing protein [Bryobacteraceae bacterium]|nr:zf-HC2 domain-containing protein [Bryobacteraceae bacterium]